MENINDYGIRPREVADKSNDGALQKAVRLALDVETDALRLNTQTFNRNKYRAVRKLDDYNGLKDRARKIKEDAIEDLPRLIHKLTSSIKARGGNVFLANSGEEANEYIAEVCKSHRAKLVVKSKSITSEEIGLNHKLEGIGVEVAETDLAEFILQVSKEQPSHIVAPAIHRSRETISELFKRNFDTDLPLNSGEELTRFAREILRQKFISADIGITGANLIAADEGAILLVESEGNIRLATQLPSVHIAVAGIEKIIPSVNDFGVFVELLAASGTGQSLSSYTNILEPPISLPVLNLNGRNDTEREFHLVLLDNGRTKMRQDEVLREALYCIRCSACMNSCANFQAVGGHAFGGECYTGGIGGAWTLGTSGSLKKASFAELCTGCSRCVPNCPVEIDIPGLNTAIKSRLTEAAGGPTIQQRFFGNFPALARIAEIAPSISNKFNKLSIARSLLENTAGIDKRRAIPLFAEQTLEKQYNKYRCDNKPAEKRKFTEASVILFCDVFTNYNNPDVGMATARVCDKLHLPISLSEVMDDGRGLLSQGLIGKAQKKARSTAAYLLSLVEEGNDIIVAEPSVLSMFRRDYRKLLNDVEEFEMISHHTYDPVEYIEHLLANGDEELRSTLMKIAIPTHRIFYHAHCQLKTIGGGNATPAFFGRFGLTVEVSNVECCGMAGSFGYKTEFYDISKRVGDDLMNQINRELSLHGDTVILASGTSCREQIRGEHHVDVRHPIEFLDALLA